MHNDKLPYCPLIDTVAMVNAMNFTECCHWLSRAIYCIETRKLNSQYVEKENGAYLVFSRFSQMAV